MFLVGLGSMSHKSEEFRYKHLLLFVFFLALQTSDPGWYSELTSILNGVQTKALQDVFVQAEQRNAALGEQKYKYTLPGGEI